MKKIFNSKLIVLIFLLGLSISCKSTSGNTMKTDSDAIKAGDSTSMNSGIKGTTRSNEGNGNESDDVPAKTKSTESSTPAK